MSFDGQRAKVYTGLSILPEQGLKGERRAQVRGLPDNGKLTDALELAKQQLLDCYNQYRTHGRGQRRAGGARAVADCGRQLV